MAQKIFAFDIDGTLLTSNHEISEGTHKALEMIKANGDIRVLATGRHWFTIRDIKEETGISKAVTTNGGAYYDFKKNKFEKPVYFNKGDVEKVIRTFDTGKNEFGFVLYTPSVYIFFDIRWYAVYDRIYLPALKENEMKWVNSIEELIEAANTHDVLKIIPISKNPEAHNISFDKFESTIGKDFEWFSGNFSTFEVNPKGVNKWSGVINVADILGVNHDDIITFGDGRNDIPMLKGAKYGVAMGQAPEDVKAVAKYITDDFDNDGILNFVTKFYNGEIK